MVSALLKYKRGGVCKKAARAADEPARPRAASPPPRAPPSPAGDLLVPRYRLRIAAFNSLKLRLEREGLERDWASMGELLSTYDVILLSEVPANLERATQMLALLNEGNTRFSMLASDPSGARGEAGEKNEVHVAYIRAGLRVVARHTHRWMDGVAMAYAPFTVLLADPNLELGPLFAVTSVHMPPEGRRDDRDKQIDRFLKTYESEARVNLNVPFTDAGAADAKHKACVHIVAGDWNATLGNSEYRARARGFDVLFGNRTATTSGRRNFDNFVLSLDARNHFEISASVLQLARPQNSRESAIGLSDHHLIALTLEREA
jgi:endonuclease/exonuclease/phosphatase family metal-dependent hydrolase